MHTMQQERKSLFREVAMDVEHLQADQEYYKAYLKGVRECRKSKGRAASGYLPSLEDVCHPEESQTEKDLGIQDIPLQRIVGTASSSRQNAFSASFLPILDSNTEFAMKWMNVYAHQVTEGLKDPIETIEYMGLHYVREGNKRVSVMKWLGGPSIRSRVVRLIPGFNAADPENRRYHAFLRFEKLTGIHSIWFSSESGFESMTRLMERFSAPERLSIPSCLDFMENVYLPFRYAFKDMGGDRFNMTTGDAFVEYARAYPAMKPTPVQETAGNLKKLMSGFRYYNDATAVTTLLAPDVAKKARMRSIADSFSPAGSAKGMQKPNQDLLRVAFLHKADMGGSTWTKAHCTGIESVSDHLPSEAITSYTLRPDETDVAGAIEDLLLAGSRIIVCTAPALSDQILHAALEHPGIRFFQCSSRPSSSHMTTYFGKLHEPLFVIGVIAGFITKTGQLGWLGPTGQPNSLTAANAFLLGARTIRPDARLLWSSGIGGKEDDWQNSSDKWEDPAIIRLVREGADCILTAPDFGFGTRGNTGLIPFALLCPQDGTPCTSENCMASMVWDWTGFYGKLFSQLMAHRGKWPSHPAKPPFVSFLGGMDTGLPDISWDQESVPAEARNLIRHLRQSIMERRFSPFQGPLKDSDGLLRVADEARMKDREILDMDWAIDGVIRL